MSLVDELRRRSREVAAAKASAKREHQRQLQAKRREELGALSEAQAVLLGAVEAASGGEFEIELEGELSDEAVYLIRRLGFDIEFFPREEPEEAEDDETDEERVKADVVKAAALQLARRIVWLKCWDRTPGVKLEPSRENAARVVATFFRREIVDEDSLQCLCEDFDTNGSIDGLNEFLEPRGFYIHWSRISEDEQAEISALLNDLLEGDEIEDEPEPEEDEVAQDGRLSWVSKEEKTGATFHTKIEPVFFADCLWRIGQSEAITELNKLLEAAASDGKRRISIRCALSEEGTLELLNEESDSEEGRPFNLTPEELTSFLIVQGMAVKEERAVKGAAKSFRISW